MLQVVKTVMRETRKRAKEAVCLEGKIGRVGYSYFDADTHDFISPRCNLSSQIRAAEEL